MEFKPSCFQDAFYQPSYLLHKLMLIRKHVTKSYNTGQYRYKIKTILNIAFLKAAVDEVVLVSEMKSMSRC